ncbi:hypothetical protein EON80_01290 [bacterium]|nr:MAG: hypothetical protein EON80_01290 [bacterium]
MSALLTDESPDNLSPEELKPRTLLDRVAFVLSATLSPYIVIPVGTVGILYARSPQAQFWQWVAISIFFSTVAPALYVVAGVLRGRITDVHVMERNQRTGPFVVAILGGFLAAYILKKMGAPVSVWGLSILLSVNGLIISAITAFTKISVHVAVLAATVLGAICFHTDINPWWLLWLIPLLIWARQKRGRHSVWQGISGAVVASFVTAATLISLGLGERIMQAFQRAL